jgi:pimeloyl-ACP methyl ester carboxylesterase
MQRRIIGTAARLLVVMALTTAAAPPVVTELTLADGGIQRLFYAAPDNPRTVALMLPGGNGMVEFGPDGAFRRLGESFLLRTLPLWQGQGFAVAVLTPPNGMSLLGYRHTDGYAAAIEQAVDHLNDSTSPPIWLVGSSQGAIAAVAAAARLRDKIAGIVVMSSVTGRSSSGETLFDAAPGRVAVPVLIIANRGDTCPASPPDDARRIAEALTRAPRKDILYVESAPATQQPCGPESPHSFFGSERDVVERVGEWIAARQRWLHHAGNLSGHGPLHPRRLAQIDDGLVEAAQCGAVADADHGRTPLGLAQQAIELCLGGLVERRGCLVEKYDRRPHQQDACEADALLLAA